MIGDEDLGIAEDDFGVTVVFNGTITVIGTFNQPSAGVSFGQGMEVEAVKPSITCRTAQITDVRNKMSALIGGITYTVEKIEPTGIGFSDVWLKTPIT